MDNFNKSSDKTFPLSKIQEQFWVLGNLSPHDTAYNIPLIYRIKGKLNTNIFKSALITLLENHEILKASIELVNNIPVFKVSTAFNVDDFFSAIRIDSNSSTQLFNEYILAEAHKPFKMSGDKLLRVNVFEFNDINYLSIVFHHIIIDLHSKYVFTSELSTIYNNLIHSKDAVIKPLSKKYSDYTTWHTNWLQSDEAGKMRAEWKKEFDESMEQLELPYQFSYEKPGNRTGKRMLFDISTDLSNKIDEFSRANNITPFVFLLSSYAILLSRISNQEKFTIGVPLSNRRQEEFSDTIGCFVNILPLSIDLSNQVSIIDLIKQVRVALLKIHRKQEIPYLELSLLLNRNPRNPLFNSGFTFEEPVDLKLDGIEIESEIIERDGAQLDLFITMWNLGNNYNGFWEYNTNKFTPESILRFDEMLKLIIKSMLENPTKSTHNFNILTENDSDFITNFNNTSCEYENRICIHQKFEMQADKTPEAPALLSKEISLSYKETDDHANRLANYLISKGVKPGDVIAISCERSIEMMTGILAILKSGACYLPLQIDNPSDRTDEIINDANPRLILSTKTGAININNKNLIVYIDTILKEPLSQNTSRPTIPLKSDSLAYILYTSGSTGKPKGTLIEHHSVLNRIGWMQKSYPLSPSDVLLQKTPITFDVSVWELFWWFFNGSKLVLLNFNGEKDPSSIAEYIEKFGVTQIHFVPSMFSPFLYYIKQNNLSKNITTLRNIFLSGEALQVQTVIEFNKLRTVNKLPSLVNLYGPTEATVDVSYYNCPENTAETDKIYIGKPIDNTNLYIVNQSLCIQPVGVKGELLITGVNLSRGYLNKPELTHKSFVQFTKPNGQKVRAYKTGDIAILSDLGEIEYLGRIDNQVKIRGMRIEPGEIESKLLQHPKILGASVIVAFEGEYKAIVAYISLKPSENLSQVELVGYISSKVPPHMVPSQFIYINTIPLTSSGKLNRKALPQPIKETKSDAIIKPSSTYETELLKLWQEILQVENISVTDNFFDIGGNSLLAIKLAMKIDEHFKIPITVMSVFEYTNIREFSRYLTTFNNKTIGESSENIDNTMDKRRNIIRKNRIRLND